jgi:glycosyltransferase involved in cell wall biosynthesis
MLAFLLAKPTQFDAPFFRWMQANRQDIPFVVFYWQPCTPASGKETAAGTDTETGSRLSWGTDLLAGYNWQQANASDAGGFGKLLLKYRVGYLVCNGWKGGFAPLVKVAQHTGIAMGLRIDSVVWEKSAIEMTVRRLYLQKMYRPFSHFFSSGTVGDEYLAAIKIPSDKWKRWPYCVDADFFTRTPACLQQATLLRQRYGLGEAPVILGVCKWVDRENPMELLRAFIKLNNPSLQLVMIGDGPLRSKMEALKATVPNLSIHFTGYVPYADLPAWYALARVFVHPARYEPWGVSVQEAMASGCSVIASNRVGSGFDLIREGKNGFMYAAANVEALALSMQKALVLDRQQVAETNAGIMLQWNYRTLSGAFESEKNENLLSSLHEQNSRTNQGTL